MRIRSTTQSVAERCLGRPFRARDRILRATSVDGLEWTKDRSFVFPQPDFGTDRMAYFATEDPSGTLWFRSSVLDRQSATWHTELHDGNHWWDVASLGVTHLYAPVWDGWRMYGVVEDQSARRRVACFEARPGRLPDTELELSWPDLKPKGQVEDVFVLRANGHFHAWCSVVWSDISTTITQWRSSDGRTWERVLPDVESPLQTGFMLANNPTVIALGGSWRMYFRTGDRPALGNRIVSATSTDLSTWVHEEGVRVSPGDLWDSHGAGFPFVRRSETHGFEMYYAGYWGACRAGERVAASWSGR